MKINFEGNFTMHPKQLLRRAGYAEFLDPKIGKISYVRRLSGGFYPRFHVYIERTSGGFHITLHLDQKMPSYGKETAHSGEYAGVVVESEGGRLEQIVNSLKL